MQMSINGGPLEQVGTSMDIRLEAEPNGETAPVITLNGTGGTVHIYRSCIHHTGTIQLHMFGDPTNLINVKIKCPTCDGIGTVPGSGPQSERETCPQCRGAKFIEGELIEDSEATKDTKLDKSE